MAKPNPRLAPLRAQVRKAHRAATNKVSRVKATTGAELSGTSHDPRGNIGNVKVLTEKQLAAQLRRLESFNSRSTQFVALKDGKPATRSAWNQHVKEQSALNAKKQTEHDSVKDIPAALGDETIGQRQAKMTADHAGAGNPAVNPFRPLNRLPGNFKDEKSLKKLTRDLQKRQNAKYDDKEHRENRKIFSKIIKDLGNDDLAKAVRKLTPKQFKYMWLYTGFVAALTKKYEMNKLVSKDEQPWYESVIEDAYSDIDVFIDWAKKIR